MENSQDIRYSSKDISTLVDTYQNNPSHEIRQRSHTILLHNKGYSLTTISRVLGREIFEINVLIKAFSYFGIDTDRKSVV